MQSNQVQYRKTKKPMRLIRVNVMLSFVILCGTIMAYGQNKSEEEHGHSHYQYHSGVPEHKLVFPSKIPDRIIVNLTEDPSHSFAVNWRTEQSVKEAFVEVALEGHGPNHRMSGVARRIKATTQIFENENKRDNEPMVKAAYHSAIVHELEPGRTYVYHVGYGDDINAPTWSEWFQIKVPDIDESKLFSFIYFGDAQNDVKSMWSRVIRKSYQMVPEVDFMMHAGDLINHSESNNEWGEWFYAGSYLHATVPSIMTPGNHEYNGDNNLSVLWEPQFNLPKNGPALEYKETFYTIDYRNMRLVSIDAKYFNNNAQYREIIIEWLEKVLAENTKTWTTLFLHYPIYSTAKGRDNTELREGLKPLIDKYGVDLVLQGHDHTYARGYDTNNGEGKTIVSDAGTVYAVSVSGPKMYESQNQDWMVKRGEFTQLFQIISVEGNKLKYQAFTPLGSLYDGFELEKSTDGSKKLINLEAELPLRLKKDFTKE